MPIPGPLVTAVSWPCLLHVCSSEIVWSEGGRCGGRALLQRLQREPDGGVELGIAARGPVVRRDCHLDVRIHAMVLRRPAAVGSQPPRPGATAVRRLAQRGEPDIVLSRE